MELLGVAVVGVVENAASARPQTGTGRCVMSLGTILVIGLILVLLGVIPRGGRRSWGYGPSGIVGVILVIVVILLLLGRI